MPAVPPAQCSIQSLAGPPGSISSPHCFQDAKIICCVRHIPWIIDSVERVVRENRFELSKIFGFETNGTVYSRAEGLMNGSGMIGFPLNALKQAMHSAQSDRLLLLPYETLVGRPAEAMDAVYAFTGLTPFRHDFEAVDFDVSEFDARLGTPGAASRPPQGRRAHTQDAAAPRSVGALRGGEHLARSPVQHARRRNRVRSRARAAGIGAGRPETKPAVLAGA